MYLKFDEFLQLIYLYNRHQLYANNNNSLRLNGFQYRFVTICRLINFNSFYCDKWRNKVLSYKTKCFRNEFVIPMQYAEHAFQTKTDNVFINTFHLISLGFVYVVQAVTQLQRLCSNYSCSIFKENLLVHVKYLSNQAVTPRAIWWCQRDLQNDEIWTTKSPTAPCISNAMSFIWSGWVV